MARMHRFVFGFLVLAASALSSPALNVEDFVNRGKPRYLRVKGLYGDAYLYQEEGARFLLYDAALKADDPRGHWTLEAVLEGTGYWIRNRVTGDGWNIEGREGFVEVSPLETSFLSFRWDVVPEESFLRIHNLWQRSAYASIENANTDKVQYDPFSPAWLSMKFQFEPVEEEDASPSEE